MNICLRWYVCVFMRFKELLKGYRLKEIVFFVKCYMIVGIDIVNFVLFFMIDLFLCFFFFYVKKVNKILDLFLN